MAISQLHQDPRQHLCVPALVLDEPTLDRGARAAASLPRRAFPATERDGRAAGRHSGAHLWGGTAGRSGAFAIAATAGNR
jgi:hypothetical protein